MTETQKLDKDVTLITAKHITRVTFKLLVTAKAEHIPSTCKPMGLLAIMGLSNMDLVLLDIS